MNYKKQRNISILKLATLAISNQRSFTLEAYSIILYRCIYSRQPVKYNVRYWIWSESESPSTVRQHTPCVRSWVAVCGTDPVYIYNPRYIIIPLAKHHVPQERFSMSVPRGIRSLNTITVRDATDLVIRYNILRQLHHAQGACIRLYELHV